MSRAACLAFVCLLAASAHASPRTDPTMGRTVFTGATTANATSLELNPAGLGLGIRNELYVAALAALDQYSIARAGNDRVSDVMVSPGGTAAGIWHTGNDGKITLSGSLNSAPAERFLENQDALRYHVLGGYQRTYAGTLGASIQFSSKFFFGISLSSQSSFLVMRYARDTALEAAHDPARGVESDCNGSPCGIENPAATETYRVSASTNIFSSSNLTANVGIVVGVAKDVWLGIAYHAPPGLAIENELTGTMRVDRAPRDGGGVVTGASSVFLSQPASIDAEVRARLPRQLDLHVGVRWEDLSRMATYDVRGYGSAFANAGIPEFMPRTRGFHDSFAGWAGVDQVDTGQPVLGGARIGVESSALTDDKTSPWTVAPTSLTLDGGIQILLLDRGASRGRLVMQLTYGLQYFPTVHVQDSAFDPNAQLSCADSGYDYTTPSCAAVRGGYALPSAAGDYSRIQHASRLSFRYEFH